MASNKMVCALASRVPTHLEGEREREREQKACVSGSLSSFVLRWHQAFFHTHSLSLAVLIVYNLLFNETDSVCPRKKKKRKKKIKKNPVPLVSLMYSLYACPARHHHHHHHHHHFLILIHDHRTPKHTHTRNCPLTTSPPP